MRRATWASGSTSSCKSSTERRTPCSPSLPTWPSRTRRSASRRRSKNYASRCRTLSRTGERAGFTESYRGILFVISSPSGGGKGTLIRRLLEAVPGVSYSVSWTTRAARPTEKDGVNYHFVNEGEFARMRDGGGFLE